MKLDDLLFAIILAGIGLSGAYLRAELALHRRLKSAELRKELSLRALQIARLRPEQNHMPGQPRTYPSPIQTNVFPAMRVLARALRINIQENTYFI